jgi:hypothetical protein
MTTLSEKRDFIKANNALIKSEKLTNATRNSLTEEQADALVEKIVSHPDYTEIETTPAVAPTLELEGVVNTEEFGALLHLPFVAKTKKSFAFQFGESLIYCNDGDLFLLAGANKIEVGQVFAFKADTIKTSPNGVLNIRLNYRADASISAVNQAIDDYQADIEAKIKTRAKLRGIDYKTAEQQIYAMIDEKEKATFVLPTFSI